MQNTPRRVGQPDLRLSTTLFFEILASSSKRTAGTSGADEAVKVALRLFPYLWTGGSVVSPGIGSIVKLVGPDTVRRVLGVISRLVVVVQRVLVRYRRDRIDFSSQHPKEVNFFLTL
jgi:hypothetical protein